MNLQKAWKILRNKQQGCKNMSCRKWDSKKKL